MRTPEPVAEQAGERAVAFVEELRGWNPREADQQELRLSYLAFVDENGPGAFERDSGRQHLTASCFVFSPDLTQVLLCFHRKGQFWVQFGGHIEANDFSVADAALREAREEGGIDELILLRSRTSDSPTAALFDLDRHRLGAGFVSCDVHFDVVFIAIAAAGAQPTTSVESEDVRWWPIEQIPTQVPPGFLHRVERALTLAGKV